MNLLTYVRRRAHLRRNVLHAIVAFVAAVALSVGAPAVAAEGSFIGPWQGVIDLPGQPLNISFVLTEQDGVLGGTVDIPAQGGYGLRLQDVRFDGTRVQFAFVDVPARVDAALVEEGGSVIEGSFYQGGMEFPFRAHRIGNEEQLEAIRAFVKSALERWHVPGAAVTIVQNGNVVMAEGFGLRDVEQQLPVTPTTLFGIGSSTKAFTTTALQMLVDEGAISWDQPLRQVIPGFRLSDPFATEHASALDFAVHRSGLPRHDMLWMANSRSDGEALIAAAEHLAPSEGFRTTWMYNNFGYMLLGHAIERVSGQPWEQFVAERLLQPLGMHGTTFTIEAMQQTDDFALAYTSTEDGLEAIPLTEIGAAAAAGAINSNAVDMGQWLLFQLSDGRIGDTVVVGAAGMQNLRTPRMVVSGVEDPSARFLSYGLGWMIDSYRGHLRVHHGGNTIGFSGNVAYMPEDNIGVVVLTNGLFTPLPNVVTNYVLDTLLGLDAIDWNERYKAAEAAQTEALAQMTSDVGRRPGTAPAHDLAEYAGVYEHPAYGTLEVVVDGGQLEARYYDVTMPLEHWHFEQFRGPWSPYVPQELPLFFRTDASGEVAAVHAGFEPMVDPIEFVRKADETLNDPAYLQQFVGTYDLMGMPADISLRGGVLVLTVPGQPPYNLAPMREGRFVFKDHDGFGVHFTYDDGGAVVKATLIQPHGNVELIKH